MYSMGKNFVVTKKCVEDPKFREKMLDFFNKESRPINMALEATVRTLPSEEVTKVYFMHPDNLSEEISEKMNKKEIEAASLTFSPDTRILEVCMGRDVELTMHLNAKDYSKK